MKSYRTAGETANIDIFTDKQCRVLDLLIEHKTSKEIARALGISPHTVDQRISLARTRLGVSSRNELAARYRIMREAVGHPPIEHPHPLRGEDADTTDHLGPGEPSIFAGSETQALEETSRSDEYLFASAQSADEKIVCPTSAEVEYRVGPEVFEGSSGGWWRLGAIVATALFLVITILGLFAIFNQITAMFA